MGAAAPQLGRALDGRAPSAAGPGQARCAPVRQTLRPLCEMPAGWAPDSIARTCITGTHDQGILAQPPASICVRCLEPLCKCIKPLFSHRGGKRRVAGAVYDQRAPALAPRAAWRAGMQTARDAAELALRLRTLEAALQWDALKRPTAEGAWAGAQLLERRPAAAAGARAGWEYLLRMGTDGSQVPCYQAPS